jgi:hypothetical protein
MVQLTSRDEAMLEWLRVVRFTDSEAIRWALPAIEAGGTSEPVHRRRAQVWSQRMAELGLVGRDRLSAQANYIVWPSPVVTGRRGPNLFGQTMRHELAVAYASARYLARGYQWTRDRRPQSLYDHQADGVATRGDRIEYVEVELTPKTADRYRLILNRHADRLAGNDLAQISYLCTPDAARMVIREADRHLFRDVRERLAVQAAFDRHGTWILAAP